jgi:hypothetical protein
MLIEAISEAVTLGLDPRAQGPLGVQALCSSNLTSRRRGHCGFRPWVVGSSFARPRMTPGEGAETDRGTNRTGFRSVNWAAAAQPRDCRA